MRFAVFENPHHSDDPAHFVYTHVADTFMGALVYYLKHWTVYDGIASSLSIDDVWTVIHFDYIAEQLKDFIIEHQPDADTVTQEQPA